MKTENKYIVLKKLREALRNREISNYYFLLIRDLIIN